jgi:hypothetical protein
MEWLKWQIRENRWVLAYFGAAYVLMAVWLALAIAHYSSRVVLADRDVAMVRSLPPVPIAVVEHEFEEVYREAVAGNFERLCVRNPHSRSCGRDSIGRLTILPELQATFSPQRPTVVSATIYGGSTCHWPATVLTLEGVDAAGQPYRFDFAAMGPDPLNVVTDLAYWRNHQFTPQIIENCTP